MESIYNKRDNFSGSEEFINSEIFSLDAEISENKAGHNQEEYSNFDFNELEFHKKKVRRDFMDAGADYVIDSIDQIREMIIDINKRLAL